MFFSRVFLFLLLFVSQAKVVLHAVATSPDEPLHIISLAGKIGIATGNQSSVITKPGPQRVIPLGQKINVIHGHVVLVRGAVAINAGAGCQFVCVRENEDTIGIQVEDNSQPLQVEVEGRFISVAAGSALRVKAQATGPAVVWVVKGPVAASLADGPVRTYAAGHQIPGGQGHDMEFEWQTVWPRSDEPVISPSTPKN